MLPPGQKARTDFPRFGLPQFTNRFPSNIDELTLEIFVDGERLSKIDMQSASLPRSIIISNFHCVTTWSYLDAKWEGVKVADLLDHLKDQVDLTNLAGAVLHAQDGNKTTLLMEDLLDERNLIADTLDGNSLSIKHGAPIRFVAPNHYGYKNVKHLTRIELYSELPKIKHGFGAFLDHPRARVDKEERGRWIPGWILRYIYRMLIPGTVKDFERALHQYESDN